MERFVKGDVVVLPFPYTDFSGVKKRPALIIATLKGDNVILAQITTNKRDDEDLVSLKIDDFASGSLKFDSFVMVSLIFTANLSMIEYKAGKIKNDKINQVEKKLIKLFSR